MLNIVDGSAERRIYLFLCFSSFSLLPPPPFPRPFFSLPLSRPLLLRVRLLSVLVAEPFHTYTHTTEPQTSTSLPPRQHERPRPEAVHV